MKNLLIALVAFGLSISGRAQTFDVQNLNVHGTATLSTPLAVTSGGIGTGSSGGTALDNITGFSGTGFLTRTGTGAYSFQSLTNGITYSNLAQAGPNTVLGNATGSTANVTALSVPTCSTSSSAVQYTGGSGWGCNTSINAATLSGNASSFYATSGANANITSLSGLSIPLSVAQGGTGQSSFAAHSVVLGEGNSALSDAAPGSSGGMLLSTGSSSNPAFGNNPTITGGTIDGAAIGSTTPAAVTGTTIIGTVFESATASKSSAASGTAYTLYTFSNTTPQCWLVSANIGTTGDTTHYDLFAVVLTDGASARIAISNAGSLMSVAMSGLNLQITQSSGVTATISVVLTRIG